MKAICMLALIAMGLAGLYFQVDYAGWVLFIGVFGIVFGDVFP